MKLAQSRIRFFLLVVFVVVINPAFADEPIPITAEEAFDAVQLQVFPGTDESATVVLVDVRAPLEIFSSGAAAAVKTFSVRRVGPQRPLKHLVWKWRGRDEVEVEPDSGKVNLVHNGKFIVYRENGRYKRLKVNKIEIESLVTEPVAYNIRIWDQTETGLNLDSDALQKEAYAFAETINRLVEAVKPDVVILYCRTGGRSSFAGQLILNGEYTFQGNRYTADIDYISEVYEIDDPSGVNGHGGFSGSDYKKVFNGYAGFPGRLTNTQEVPSASWKDSGLPVIRRVLELPPE